LQVCVSFYKSLQQLNLIVWEKIIVLDNHWPSITTHIKMGKTPLDGK
jgi:hypothetical protein